jgi:hypothetical protein
MKKYMSINQEGFIKRGTIMSWNWSAPYMDWSKRLDIFQIFYWVINQARSHPFRIWPLPWFNIDSHNLCGQHSDTWKEQRQNWWLYWKDENQRHGPSKGRHHWRLSWHRYPPNGDTITFTQDGPIKQIIKALGLNTKYSIAKSTTAENKALGKDPDGLPASGKVNYASVIGMLLYLNHSGPEIAFSTHQCARYTFGPKQTHKDTLKRIGQYLKGTIGKGLIMTPSAELKLDCYHDANFAWLLNRDNKHDPHCVCSCTGYVICLLSVCPV